MIVSELIKTPEGKLRVDSANETVDRSVAEQTERQDNRQGTSKGEKKKDDHLVPPDPPTPARVEPFVPLSSVAAEPVERVSSVRVGPSASSGAPVARPNFVDEHREMGEHVESSAPEAGSGADVGVENSGMDVDRVDGGDDAFQKLLAIWTDQEVVEAQRLNCESMKYCEISWWPWCGLQKRTL